MDQLTTSNEIQEEKPLFKAVLEQAAITSIALGATVPLNAFDVVINELASTISQVPLTVFRGSPVSLVPTVIMFFCLSGLLRNFIAPQNSRGAKAMRAVLAGFLLVASTANGAPGLLAFVAGLAAWIAACRLGLAMRRAMPPTFRYQRALAAAFIGYVPLLAFMLAIVFGLAGFHTNPSSAYGALGSITPSYIVFVTLFIGSMLAFPAFMIAKSARTGESKPLILLAVLLNSPVILALAMLPTAALFIPDLAPYYSQYMLACLPMPLAAILMTTAGAWAGAKSNAFSHSLKIRQQEASLKLKS